MSDWMSTPVKGRDDYGRTYYELPGGYGKAVAVKIPRKNEWFVNKDRFSVEMLRRHAAATTKEERKVIAADRSHIVNGLTRAQALAMVASLGRWTQEEVATARTPKLG